MERDELGNRIEEIRKQNRWTEEKIDELLWDWLMDDDNLLSLFVMHLEGLSKDSE